MEAGLNPTMIAAEVVAPLEPFRLAAFTVRDPDVACMNEGNFALGEIWIPQEKGLVRQRRGRQNGRQGHQAEE
jgi:hypothetical protein